MYFGYLSICSGFLNDLDVSEMKILDAGCGDGRFLSELKNKGAKNLYGVDYSESALSFAKLFLPDVKFTNADLANLPYEDNFFDYIFLIETLEHIHPEKTNNVLKELKRVLKPSGRLIVTVPSVLVPLNKKHYRHFSEKTLRDCLADFFDVKSMAGQDYGKFHILKFAYKFLDNRFWLIKPLAEYYNLNIWPKYFNGCSVYYGNRLIVECVKK